MASASCARPPSRLEEFAELAKAVGLPLERFQEKIVEAVFAGTRELLVLLPRGNGKTTIFAALALYSLLTTDEPAIYVAAARATRRVSCSTSRVGSPPLTRGH